MDLIDELLDPFVQCLSPESARRVVNFKISAQLQHQLDKLSEKANAGDLTDDEIVRFEAIIDADDFVAFLKLKVQDVLERQVT